MERRIAVIMSADLVGYTRLMEQDEVGTWGELRALRKRIIDPALEKRGGKIFKTTGDGILVEFPSSVDAVEACVQVQNAIHDRYLPVSDEHRLRFRVGIATGDVIVDGDDLIGDAVNVAARLEGVCEPGGVCVSEPVFSACRRNCEIPFEDIGEVELRNRAEAVRSYVWRHGATNAPGEAWGLAPAVKIPSGVSMRSGIRRTVPSGLPSVAVLPFDNFSDDDELGFFASGIAEDITTELYRFSSFSVISRTSAFMYRGQRASAREIGSELGASYVLEGSLRKMGKRLRIGAQLIDVADNDHVWAERFDIELSEILDAQDHIVARIVSTLGDGIERHRLRRSRHLAPAELEAYELMLRGLEAHKQGYVSYEQAVETYNLFCEAVEKDPNLARARAWKVCAWSRLWPAKADPEALNSLVDDALSEIRVALAQNDEEPEAHRIYGAICLFRRDFERGKHHVDKALAINPNNAHVLAKSGNFYSYYGNPQKTLDLLDRAITINPHHPEWYWQEFGLARWVNEDYSAAVDYLGRLMTLTDVDHAYLAASHAALGQENLAKDNSAYLSAINPNMTATLFAERQPFRLDAVRDRLSEQLITAGMR